MRDINKLHPWLQYKLKLLQKECQKEKLKLGIGECFRSVEEQQELYAKGRSKPGPVVTNARGSSYSSQHQWGIAVDLFQNKKGKEYDEKFLRKVADIAKSSKVGLAWGGDWKSFVDTSHFYLDKWGSTTAKLKKKFGDVETFQKYWYRTTKKKGNLYKERTMRLGKKLESIPVGEELTVLWYSGLGYAKVQYKEQTGYVFRSILKKI